MWTNWIGLMLHQKVPLWVLALLLEELDAVILSPSGQPSQRHGVRVLRPKANKWRNCPPIRDSRTCYSSHKKRRRCVAVACDVAALLEERDPALNNMGADLGLRVEMLQRFRNNERIGDKNSGTNWPFGILMAQMVWYSKVETTYARRNP